MGIEKIKPGFHSKDSIVCWRTNSERKVRRASTKPIVKWWSTLELFCLCFQFTLKLKFSVWAYAAKPTNADTDEVVGRARKLKLSNTDTDSRRQEWLSERERGEKMRMSLISTNPKMRHTNRNPFRSPGGWCTYRSYAQHCHAENHWIYCSLIPSFPCEHKHAAHTHKHARVHLIAISLHSRVILMRECGN